MLTSYSKLTYSTLLIFLKAPHIGKVKTRLAQSIGPDLALQIYQSMVKRQLSEFFRSDPIEIHFSPADAGVEMRSWLGDDHAFYPQCDGGLGSRLEQAVVDAFARGAKSVICIGGDCPRLNRAHLKEAETCLKSDYDCVFGPSDDGGYYLIGLNSPQVELFRDIPWSTDETLKVSLSKSYTLGLRVKLLETLYDVDELSELDRAVKENLLHIKQFRQEEKR